MSNLEFDDVWALEQYGVRTHQFGSAISISYDDELNRITITSSDGTQSIQDNVVGWRPRPSVDMTPDPEVNPTEFASINDSVLIDCLPGGVANLDRNGNVVYPYRHNYGTTKSHLGYVTKNGNVVETLDWGKFNFWRCFQVLHIGKDVSWLNALIISVFVLMMIVTPSLGAWVMFVTVSAFAVFIKEFVIAYINYFYQTKYGRDKR